MTDAELRDAAWAELVQTTVGWNKVQGYTPAKLATTHWGKAKSLLDQIGQVAPPPPPPPTSEVVWTTDAYAPGDFSLWTAQQEIAADRVQVVTPPAEVGGGPRNRSKLGRFRIEAGDEDTITAGSQRAECYRGNSDGVFGNHLCQGDEVWVAWESYFGDPAVVSDANAFRPQPATWWNAFISFHQSAGLFVAPMQVYVNTTNGPSPSQWEFKYTTIGGDERNARTSHLHHLLKPFSYGWHEFRFYVKWGQANGRVIGYVDGAKFSDYTGPVGYNPDSTGGICNYFKQGMYRGKYAAAMTVFHGGTRMGTTEAAVL